MARRHVCLTVCADVAPSSVRSRLHGDLATVDPRFTRSRSPATRPRHFNAPKLKSEKLIRDTAPHFKRHAGNCWLSARASGRTLTLEEDAEALAELAKLDGCYVLKTDLTSEQA
ncbi:MAG: hypothetical protein IH899_10205, partial [Planctomycetes bacterium]|nr:hypothetical protein [Planctomycetota bacterium]